MGDVVDLPTKPKIVDELTVKKYFDKFVNGFVTIGFDAEGKAGFVVLDLDASDINWLLDRLKHQMLVEQDKLDGYVIDVLADTEHSA